MSAGTVSNAGAPLDAAALRATLIRPGGLWRDISVVAETGSTNRDLLAAAARGAPEGTVLAAEAQTAGRGRLGRSWVSVPGEALTFSVLLRPRAVPPASRGWIPLLTGVAVASALRAETGVDALLKWPNDVLVNGAKLAGILAEQSGDAVVVGIGVNVRAAGRADLPSSAATSLALQGVVCASRTALLAGLLGELGRWYLRWTGAGCGGADADAGEPGATLGNADAGEPGATLGNADATGLRQDYLRLCATVGRQVRVSLPGGRTLAGTACDVDDIGGLVVRSAAELIHVSAGDVTHVR